MTKIPEPTRGADLSARRSQLETRTGGRARHDRGTQQDIAAGVDIPLTVGAVNEVSVAGILKIKQKQKDQEKRVAATAAAYGSGLPTAFDQMVVISSAVSIELGVPQNGLVPRPDIVMPGWGGSIIKQFGKTILKPILKLRPMGKVDWRNYGRMVTVMERYRTFVVHDAPQMLEKVFADLTEEEWRKIEPQLGLDQLRVRIAKMLGRPVADDEPWEKLVAEVWARVAEKLERHKQAALYQVAQQSPKMANLFYKGMSEGYGLVIDEQGNFCGDRGRTNIYCCLIGCMMEVETIRRTLPPITRSQFYDGLAKTFNLPPNAHEWFSDVCDDIKFPLNSLGRKRQRTVTIL